MVPHLKIDLKYQTWTIGDRRLDDGQDGLSPMVCRPHLGNLPSILLSEKRLQKCSSGPDGKREKATKVFIAWD